jgi:hypothetical protein
MPTSAYFKGHGAKVKRDMIKRYGTEKGERVFHATAQKRGMKPGSTKRSEMVRQFVKQGRR